MQQLPLAVGKADHMAAPVGPDLAFALRIEQEIEGDIGLAQLIPEGIKHLEAVVIFQPAIGRRDQQIDVGFGPACPRALEPNRRTSQPGMARWITAAIAGSRSSICPKSERKLHTPSVVFHVVV
jgi:hypothetical protein